MGSDREKIGPLSGGNCCVIGVKSVNGGPVVLCSMLEVIRQANQIVMYLINGMEGDPTLEGQMFAALLKGSLFGSVCV